MKNYLLLNIEQETVNNTDYRRVLFTTHHVQLVVMCIKPGEEIGNEIHGVDQFIRIEQGRGKAILHNGEQENELAADIAIIVPAGTWHNIVNTGDEDLKLYTLYAPPEHKRDTMEKTKTDEEEDHFDGLTSLT